MRKNYRTMLPSGDSQSEQPKKENPTFYDPNNYQQRVAAVTEGRLLEDAVGQAINLLQSQLQQLQQDVENRAQMVQNDEQEPATSIEAAELSDTIELSGNTSESVVLPVSNLLYVESVGNYVKVCWLHEDKVRTDMLRATSKQVEENLRPYPIIVRCHRAFLVNLHQVEKILSQSGTMQLVIKQCGDHLPVSRSNMTQVKEAIKGIR